MVGKLRIARASGLQNVECLTQIPHFLFPQGAWLTEESKALKGDMQAAGNQQADVRIALASAPNIASKTLEEAAVRCDQHGMLSSDFGICAPSEEMKIWSASPENSYLPEGRSNKKCNLL